MDNFKVIYRILHYLEKAMDLDELDRSRLTPEALGVTERRWLALWEMLAKEGYVAVRGKIPRPYWETKFYGCSQRAV